MAGLKTRWLSWLDGMLPPELRSGDAALRRRARLCVSLPLVCALGAALAVAAQLALGRPLVTVVAAIGGCLASLACSQLVRWTGSVNLAGNVTTGLLFGFVSLGAVLVGGLGAPRAFALCIIPMLGALLVDARTGVRWAFVCLVEVGALLALRVAAPDLLPDVPATTAGAHAAGVGVLILVGMLVIVSYDRAHAAVTKELEKERERANAASKLKSALVANVSHELRTPLNGIVGSVELMRGGELSGSQAEHAETIREASEALLRLVDDLLDKSRLESGGMELEERPFRLRRSLGGAMRALGPIAEERGGGRLILHVDADVPEAVVGDPYRLRQIVTNLANNAIKFTDEGQVCVRVSRREERVRFEVRDTGIGVAPADLERLFEAFEQAGASTARERGGTGLGLDIARRLVRLMGSEIHVESEVGVGSRFWFDLALRRSSTDSIRPGVAPLRIALELSDEAEWEAAAAALVWAGHEVVSNDGDLLVHDDPSIERPWSVQIVAPSALEAGPRDEVRVARPFAPRTLASAVEQAAMRSSGRQRAAAGGRVLVADDTELNRRVIEGQLRKLGFEPIVVTGGEEALAEVRARAFDAVMLDLSMPGMDGYEAAVAIRERERSVGAPRHPLIALTGYQSAEHQRRAREVGFDAYLTKPLRLDELEGALASLRRKPLPVVAEASWRDLEAMGEGSPGFVAELVESFLETSADRAKRLEAGEDVEATAHALRGAAAQIGALALASACERIEDEPARVEELLPHLRAELARAGDELTRRVAG